MTVLNPLVHTFIHFNLVVLSELSFASLAASSLRDRVGLPLFF